MKLHRYLIFAFFMLAIPRIHAEKIITSLPINKVILWGHKHHSHTHYYIHRAFQRAFAHLGYEAHWFDNSGNYDAFDFSNSLFITEGQVDEKMPARDDCFYILHNCSDKRYQPLYKSGRAITLQVYTHDCINYHLTKIDECTCWDIASSLIHMPWATDLLPDEIEENKRTLSSHKNNEVVFIGSVGGGIHGNIEHINPFAKAARENNMAFYQRMGCSMEENINRVKNAYMAPAIQGSWQVKQGYIPCRIFKNISYGAFGITNSETVYNLFDKKIVYNPDAYQLFYDAKNKLDNLDVNELLELMDFVKNKHTYINRIGLLLEFLELVYNQKNNKEGVS